MSAIIGTVLIYLEILSEVYLREAEKIQENARV
jgi:hypothetical protein